MDIKLQVVLKGANILEAQEDFLRVHPMPRTPDPDWVDPGDGSEPPMVDKYASTIEWAGAYLVDHMWLQLERGAMIKHKHNRIKRSKTAYISNKLTTTTK